MNFLVLTSYRPNHPVGGAALRNWQNINVLRRLGTVDVVSVGVEETSGMVEGIRDWVPFPLTQRSKLDELRTRLWPLRPGVYPGIDLYRSQAVTGWLRARARRQHYDVAVIETIAMASYLDDLRPLADRIVFDAHNVEADLHATAIAAGVPDGSVVRRVKNCILGRRMAATERRVVCGSDLVWACSELDAAQLMQLYNPRHRVSVVANGVDVNAYQAAEACPAGSGWGRSPITLLYAGMFGYPPNEAAALRLITQVLPAVRSRGFPANAILVGCDPTQSILAAAEQATGVEVTGAVPRVLPYLARPCVVTLPINLGSGTRLKVLEAFAAGRPVVSTAKGVEGIDCVDGEHVLIREDPDAIAEAVIGLWQSPAQRGRQCASAAALVRQRYSWESAGQRIAADLGVSPSRPHIEYL